MLTNYLKLRAHIVIRFTILGLNFAVNHLTKVKAATTYSARPLESVVQICALYFDLILSYRAA